MKIKNKTINQKSKTFIIAELSGNHNHSFDIAVKSIEAMKKAGVDAVKLQTYTADTLTIRSNNKYFKINEGLWKGKTLHDLYNEAYTPWDWQPKLKNIAEKLGLIFFSSPFDKTAVDFLEKMNVPVYKVASFELNDTQLVKYIASKKKPMILSTGIATLNEINDAVDICKPNGSENYALLKCTSAYPAPYEDVNLLTIPNMQKVFNVIIGLSDHTLGISVPVAAVTLGAKIIEKHFILDKAIKGPDSEFSLEPKEFKQMVDSIRQVEKAIGKVSYDLSDKVKKSRIFKRSIFIVKNIKKGEVFTKTNVRSIRPGFGIAPKYINIVIGKKANKNLSKGTPLTWDVI